MAARDNLHHLVDELPEEDIPTAARVLQALSATAAPQVLLDEAPLDDEPDDDDLDGGLTEARAGAQAGRVVPHEEVKRRWAPKASPLDVVGVDLGLSAEEIVSAIRETRARDSR